MGYSIHPKHIHHNIHLLYIIIIRISIIIIVIIMIWVGYYYYVIAFKQEDSWTCYLDHIHFDHELNEHNPVHPI